MTESVGLGEAVEPVKIVKKAKKPVKMVTVFELDGREYQVPAEPGPGLAIQFQRERKTLGLNEASMNALTAFLGDEAVAALAESPDVDLDDITNVYTVVGKIFFGGVHKLGDAAGN